jgi:hypothetical protein
VSPVYSEYKQYAPNDKITRDEPPAQDTVDRRRCAVLMGGKKLTFNFHWKVPPGSDVD